MQVFQGKLSSRRFIIRPFWTTNSGWRCWDNAIYWPTHEGAKLAKRGHTNLIAKKYFKPLEKKGIMLQGPATQLTTKFISPNDLQLEPSQTFDLPTWNLRLKTTNLKKEKLIKFQNSWLNFRKLIELNRFGSRAMGNAKLGSDLDLAVVGAQVDDRIMSKITDSLENKTNLPYLIDLIHFDKIENLEPSRAHNTIWQND